MDTFRITAYNKEAAIDALLAHAYLHFMARGVMLPDERTDPNGAFLAGQSLGRFSSGKEARLTIANFEATQ